MLYLVPIRDDLETLARYHAAQVKKHMMCFCHASATGDDNAQVSCKFAFSVSIKIHIGIKITIKFTMTSTMSQFIES